MPPPKGYTLDTPVNLPKGYTLDNTKANPQDRRPQGKQTVPDDLYRNIEAGLRHFSNGMTFGFGDNLQAALESLPLIGNKKQDESYGQAYDRNLAYIRSQMNDFQDKNPYTAGGLDMAGGIASGFLTGGASAGTGQAVKSGAGQVVKKQTLPLAQRVTSGAVRGAAYGAISNAGNSNADTTTEMLRAGAVGGGVGAVGGASVPVLMEGLNRGSKALIDQAMRISPRDRAFGKTPAEAALAYTTGSNPVNVEQSSTKVIDALTKRNENLASGVPVDISKAQQFIQNAVNSRSRRQNSDLTKELQEMADFLTSPVPNYGGTVGYGASGVAQQSARGLPGVGGSGPIVNMGRRVIHGIQDGADAVKLKQDFSDKFLSWNADKRMTDKAEAYARRVYRMLDREIDKVSPEVSKNNQVISSLIPVKRGADLASRQPGIVQNMVQRATAMTGASILGSGLAGYAYGGVPYALAGAAIPAVLSDPGMATAAARGLYGVSRNAPLQELTRYVLSQSPRYFYQK